MRIAYFVNQYPKVSHTFIRREIQALERLDVEVTRISVRNDKSELADTADLAEFDKTISLLAGGIGPLILSTLRMLFSRPKQFLHAAKAALRLGWNSDRGLFRHAIYLAEGCKLVQVCQANAIDHAHAHFGTNSTTVVHLSALLGGPTYSFTVHGPEEFDKPQFIRLRQKTRNARFVVAISSYGKSQLYRFTDFADWEKIHEIHCGIELSDFADVPPISTDEPRLVCIGRLSEQKGQLFLIDMLAKVKKTVPDIKLVLVGDGEMRSVVEARIREHDLQENVIITGWADQSKIKQELTAARGLLLPSFAEGLPVVIMEAMAAGRPVVTTYIAGIPELVQPGKTGWLVPAGDGNTLTEAVVELLQAKPETLNQYGANARQRVAKRHNIDVEAQKLKMLFDEVSGQAT